MICLILISNICNCQEKAGSIGLNLTSLIFHTAELGISYGFCRQWSISAETAINLNGIWKDKEYLEKEHADEFNDRYELISPEDRHRESIYIYLSGRTQCIQAHIYPQEQDSERQADMTVWPGSDTWPAYGKAYYSALTSGLEYRKS